jgi:NitT/TauT family transport system substrate-binding protein
VPKEPEKVALAFLNGESDACVTWEPHVSEALRRPGAHILTNTKEHPDIIIDTLNMRRDLVENDPGLAKKVMRAWFKGLAYYRDHPLEASETIAKYYKITPEQYRKLNEGIRWVYYEEQKAFPEYREWQEIFNTIVAIKSADKRISRKPDAAKFLNRTLIEKLYENSR